MKIYYQKSNSNFSIGGIVALATTEKNYVLLSKTEKFLSEDSEEVRYYKAAVDALVKADTLKISAKASAMKKLAKVAGLTDEELAALFVV